MDPDQPVIVQLANAGERDEALVGGKARTLGRLIQAGYKVPNGFCISVSAYERFLETAGLEASIAMELERKSFSTMRWEEIWDSALRIRSAFLAASFPEELAHPIIRAHRELAPGPLAVRSSAPGEDSGQRSHAGLHESLVGVRGEKELIDSVKIVWSSLWSDAALLYRRELGLDVFRSRMAVVVQEFVRADPSGVGFGVDPRQEDSDHEVIEAVPGPCEDLVSGMVDPDRWIMKRSSGEVVEWKPGRRGEEGPAPILREIDLEHLHRLLRSVEDLLKSPPDVEWTGRHPELTLLQARPVTGLVKNKEDEREWYLSLRPRRERLRALCERVVDELIPALEAEASRFAAEDIQSLSDADLAGAIAARQESLENWKTIYKDEFIPFAHGVRQLGQYYNDAVRPDDPYEFVGLLRAQPMIASERNIALRKLASRVGSSRTLADSLARILASSEIHSRKQWREQSRELMESPAEIEFCREFEAFLDQYMNLAFEGESLDDRPDLSLRIILEMSGQEEREQKDEKESAELLEQRLLEAVGQKRREEAIDVLRVARLSWRLRDDDNILIGRLQNQLQRGLAAAADRLKRHGRLDRESRIEISAAETLVAALREAGGEKVLLPGRQSTPEGTRSLSPGESFRQLIGQPAAPGLATGIVRVIRDSEDFGNYRRGEVMVCDAIQPTMTHLVPLASAIIERRGGMLIHGAIIARELGVPCVNGVPDAATLLENGDLVTVDGYLGIVTVGRPEFEMEGEAYSLSNPPTSEMP